MSQHPPPPTPLDYAPPPGRNDLRTIATRQKAIMYCILGNIVFTALLVAVPSSMRIVPALLAFAVAIVGAVFVFMLALALYNTAAGVILGILTLIPLVGLIVLLIINGKATKVLREHGISVGLMGAKTDQIPAPGQMPMQ